MKTIGIYTQFIEDDGPLPTTFTFFESDDYELIGTTQEGETIEEFDPNFDMTLQYFEHEAVFTKVKALGKTKVNGELMFMVCDETQCLPPEYVDFSFSLGESASVQVKSSEEEEQTESSSTLKLVSVDNEESEKEQSNKQSMWSIFFIAFLSGFAALLTPCVFPMIPMTVSYFTKQSKSKAKGVTNAIIYGLSIIFIYVALE